MAAQEGRLYFAYFSASWCLPCQWMEKNTFTDTGLSDYVATTYLAVKMDIDDRQGLAAQQQYEVTMLPSILIFNSQGVLVGRSEESLNAEQLIAMLYQHDLPRNRIQPHSDGNEQVLESPTARLNLYRPALVPDVEYAATNSIPPTSSNPPPAYRLASPTISLTPSATEAARNEVASARLEKGYGIQVGSYSDYSNAVRWVAQLESQFNHPVNLLANQQHGKMIYKIMLGVFQDRTSAEEYLVHLRQHRVDGFVREIGSRK